MNDNKVKEIDSYISNQEYIANKYVVKCFHITILILTVALVLNLVDIFTIKNELMWSAYIPAIMIYLTVCIIAKVSSLSRSAIKYLILFFITSVFTIAGVFITYHIVLVSFVPFLFGTLYSSKKMIRYVYVLSIVSTFITVYCGYYFGLCDANMVLLTSNSVADYVVNGQFTLKEINANPPLNLFIFFVMPRCLMYTAFMVVCNSLFTIVSGSVEKARLASELEKAKQEAERANAAKTQFLFRMSHEIRTPINAIMGMNEMILRESNNLEILEYAQEVKDSSNVLLNIVNEILDSSKIEAGKMELVEDEYETGSLLNDLYNMINVKAKEKNLELILDVDSKLPSILYGDSKRIRQVLLNILSNAVKYTERGKITMCVNYTKDGDTAKIRYTVTDTGIGIKEDDIGKIYDEFQRFDLARNRQIEGTGLGMNIVQAILKMLGSELDIKSEYEKGSEFSFEISQKIINEQPLDDFKGRMQKATEVRKQGIEFVAPSAKILVVDDYKINLKVFKNLLKKTQMIIKEAESGRECIEILRNEKFDMVFLDHMMPDMDGIETLQVIKEEHLCDSTPMIMLTANAIVGDREKYLKMGFDEFLSKPIVVERLEEVIMRFLSEEKNKPEETKDNDNTVTKRDDIMKFNDEKLQKLYEELPQLDFEMGLATCSGDEEFYLELMSDFVNLDIRNELVSLYEEKDYKNYCIRIHGFKNSAWSVGAKRLGDLAYEMEKSTREGFTEDISSMQKQLFEEYNKICGMYNNLIGE